MGKSGRNITKGRVEVATLLCFGFGVVFICVLLYFASFVPNPSPFQFHLFVTVLALSAAGVGAALPGYLEIQKPGLLRAGGALGLFVMVQLGRPVLRQEVVTFQEPPQDPAPLAEMFLAVNDQGRISAAWSLLDPAVRGISFQSEDYYQTTYREFRQPLGTVESRREIGRGGAQSPPGLPIGLYRNIFYTTKFSNDRGCRDEVVILRATETLVWRVASYQIEPHDSDCNSRRRPTEPTSL